MTNAGQITYQDNNNKTQTLDVFHDKNGNVRVKKRGGLPGIQGDTVVFENGNFVNDSLLTEFYGTATSEEQAASSMIKKISQYVNASIDGLGGNSNGWTKPPWVAGGLKGEVFEPATVTTSVPGTTSTNLNDYGGYDWFLGATGDNPAPLSAQYPVDALY